MPRSVPFAPVSELLIWTIRVSRPAALEFLLAEEAGEKAAVVAALLELDRDRRLRAASG